MINVEKKPVLIAMMNTIDSLSYLLVAQLLLPSVSGMHPFLIQIKKGELKSSAAQRARANRR